MDMLYLQVITYRIFKEFALLSDSAVSLSLDFSTIRCVQPSALQRFALCAAQQRWPCVPHAPSQGHCQRWVWVISALGREWFRRELITLAWSAVCLELGSQFVRKSEFWNRAGGEKCFMCLMCAPSAAVPGPCQGWCWVCDCANPAAKGTSAPFVHAQLHRCPPQVVLKSPPFPNLTAIDPCMECRMNLISAEVRWCF